MRGCKECAWWEYDDVYNGVSIGYCHKNPPQVDGSGESCFPSIASYEWCGEWKPREEKDGENATD